MSKYDLDKFNHDLYRWYWTSPLPKRLLELRIRRNQKSILNLLKHHDRIKLLPVPPSPEGGHVEHYYHFIFDLLLPLSILLEHSGQNAKYCLDEFGILTPILERLTDERVMIRKNEGLSNGDLKEVKMIGMSPLLVNIHNFQYSIMRDMVFRKLHIPFTTDANKLIVIERIQPHSYYTDEAIHKGSGTSRISIQNHK